MSGERVDAIVDDVRSRLGALEDAVRTLSAIGATVRSTDGLVVAAVDHQGGLTAMSIDDAACALDADALSALVLRTVHEAAGRVAGERARVLTDLGARLDGDGPARSDTPTR